MIERAKENGYTPTGISDLEDQGDRQIAFDRASLVRDAIVEHKVGPSAFKEAKGIVDSPETFKNAIGFSLSQVLGAAVGFLADPSSNIKGAYDKVKTTTLNGIQSYQNGNYRGL